MKPLTDAQYRQLTRLVCRDLALDTLANLLLGLGLYLAFSDEAVHWPLWLQSPYAKALLIATGVINLRFLPLRFRRLQVWQLARQLRQKR